MIQKVWVRELTNVYVNIFMEKLSKVASAFARWGSETFGKLPKKI